MAVTISYGYKNGFMDDCDDTSGWTKTDNGNTSTFTIDNDDYFKLDVTVSGGNEETKVVNDTNIGVSTTVYTQIRCRYKCSNANIKAKIIAEYTGAEGTKVVLADISSTTWTVVTVTLDSAKTLDHIQLYADHAVGTVYYDFILVYKGDFTLPNTAGGMNLDPLPVYSYISIPSRTTDITQNLGSECAVINLLGCDLDQGTWKRTTPADTIDGEVFLEIAHNSGSEPWQWLETGSHKFKVTVHPRFYWRNNGDGSTSRLLDLVFREYSLGDKGDETHVERFGI